MARIIVVDDSSFTRYVLKAYLEKSGHDVVAEAGSPTEAVRMYKEHKPDIVTMDIWLTDNAEKTGIDALQEIKDFDNNANVIMCSAAAHYNNVVDANNKGAKNFLAKPVCGEKLAEVIEEILSVKN